MGPMQIRKYDFDGLGGANHGWLRAKHHFSFASYQNPERLRFGLLRVINDDRIQAGKGFDTHSHEDMEIITYVRKGAITHRDSRGNEGRTVAGDVQVMSAGSGIAHSEYNFESEETNLYQIWIFPDKKAVEPRWESRTFPKDFVDGELSALVSGRKEDIEEGALMIHQDAAIFGGRLKASQSIHQKIKHQAYILVSEGEVRIDSTTLRKGDGAELTETNEFSIEAVEDSEVLVIDVPDRQAH